MVKSLHYSFGERRAPSDPLDAEKPHVTFPLYRVMDWFVVTPEGKETRPFRRRIPPLRLPHELVPLEMNREKKLKYGRSIRACCWLMRSVSGVTTFGLESRCTVHIGCYVALHTRCGFWCRVAVLSIALKMLTFLLGLLLVDAVLGVAIWLRPKLVEETLIIPGSIMQQWCRALRE